MQTVPKTQQEEDRDHCRHFKKGLKGKDLVKNPVPGTIQNTTEETDQFLQKSETGIKIKDHILLGMSPLFAKYAEQTTENSFVTVPESISSPLTNGNSFVERKTSAFVV